MKIATSIFDNSNFIKKNPELRILLDVVHYLGILLYLINVRLFAEEWSVRFPRNLQQSGAKFMVDGLIPNEKYQFYRYLLLISKH